MIWPFSPGRQRPGWRLKRTPFGGDGAGRQGERRQEERPVTENLPDGSGGTLTDGPPGRTPEWDPRQRCHGSPADRPSQPGDVRSAFQENHDDRSHQLSLLPLPRLPRRPDNGSDLPAMLAGGDRPSAPEPPPVGEVGRAPCAAGPARGRALAVGGLRTSHQSRRGPSGDLSLTALTRVRYRPASGSGRTACGGRSVGLSLCSTGRWTRALRTSCRWKGLRTLPDGPPRFGPQRGEQACGLTSARRPARRFGRRPIHRQEVTIMTRSIRCRYCDAPVPTDQEINGMCGWCVEEDDDFRRDVDLVDFSPYINPVTGRTYR